MKKLLITLLTILLSLNALAEGTVNLEKKGKNENGPHQEVPVVDVEGRMVTIHASKPIANVIVVIRDINNEIVVHRHINIEPASKLFEIPDPRTDILHTYCIELYTKDNVFYGYFTID